ncbi:MAG: hypothetical protein QF436_00050 [Candidatus Woesearchaeota archaeon]|jgi:hypothetical protein|nr:hypothetical protein [archaeon]MDP6548281.1 hypothetical protein [Candidatus Woesearchaeota archaeon]MDP7263189.1 hypothetical protein [Candidatus Woesearchaeota archaeon]MDP7622498.1 hypothetical protein [Candidatus Woesearchaeota archaeon]HJN56604.1 hypothetical protein [Candidatus Woesearchaeota archaeon]|tara:strand:- start:30461 stop:30940 length:480 start_codon:yes stop_codon:yes gene_type:complete
MADVNSYLVGWSIRFLENKDHIKKEIVKVKKNSEGFDFAVHYKDKVKYFIVGTVLKSDLFGKIKNELNISLITLNNISNIKFVIDNWKKLSDFKLLSIYFINPFSNSDKVWVICPYIHNMVCDNIALELGLKSMGEMVVAIDVDGLNKKIKMLKEESDQ